jgi:hypothetical protein
MDAKPRISFGLRTLLELTEVVAVILAMLYGGTDWLSGNGRYQAVPVVGPGSNRFILLDTKTGKMWRESGRVLNGEQVWVSYGPSDL